MNNSANRYFAVIDVETNYDNELISVGVAVADADTFSAVDKKYYVIYPECRKSAMYSSALWTDPDCITKCSRSGLSADLTEWLDGHNVTNLFAYNVSFDYSFLPELNNYVWHDIMNVAAYRQYNQKMPPDADCGPSGRLKRGRGVQSIMRMMLGDDGYVESHNALRDAVDELQIMRLLEQPLSVYPVYKPKQNFPTRKTVTLKRRYDKMFIDFKYVVDELSGGAVRLLDCYNKAVKVGDVEDIRFCLILQCSRCGHKWTQIADYAYIQQRKCPICNP